MLFCQGSVSGQLEPSPHSEQENPEEQEIHFMNNIRKEVLDNGLTILTEQMPHVRSISMGVWLKIGSRSETSEINGVAHFIEHLLFKGTSNRTAEEIARQVDSIGGHLDAFTAKETICYSTKVLDEHLPIA